MLWSGAPSQISKSVNHFGVGCSCFLVTDVIHLYVASANNSCSEQMQNKMPKHAHQSVSSRWLQMSTATSGFYQGCLEHARKPFVDSHDHCLNHLSAANQSHTAHCTLPNTQLQNFRTEREPDRQTEYRGEPRARLVMTNRRARLGRGLHESSVHLPPGCHSTARETM